MSADLEFAERFVRDAGTVMVQRRTTTRRRKKLDRTDVTDVDTGLNDELIKRVKQREGRHASVRGEERSNINPGTRRLWVVDPVDGTGEYIDDSIPDTARTTCVGLALFVNGKLTLSMVYNPFRKELFVAGQHSPTRLNDRTIACKATIPSRDNPYDYCHWSGARFDVSGLERRLGEPRGVYSAIYQACEVAAGRSAFAVFPGDTVHDIAPATLLVAQAGGVVTDLRGKPLVWRDLNHGVLYASRAAHRTALRLIASL
jgi:fructose-1,6-bisphosphatase/inositol monophosphatase family enzyme